MCGAKARSISEVFLPAERRTVETRWCPQCGALGIRDRRHDETLYESWEEPQRELGSLEFALTELLPPLD